MRSIKKITPHSIALVLASLVLISALALISLARWLSDTSQDTVTVRTVDTISLPPPPPPPKPVEQQQIEMPTIALNTQGNGPQIDVSLAEPKVEFTQPPMDIKLAIDAIDWEQNLAIDWQAFGLGELDDLPRLLTELRFNIPRSIRRSGVKTFDIVLDVMIDEEGKVTLIAIPQNPYPSFVHEIKRLVKAAKFTPPRKDGEVVKARFNWPIEVSNI